MRKIIGFYTGPYCGTDSCEAFVVPFEATEVQIVNELMDWAYDLHNQWVEDDEEIEDEGPDFCYKDYDPEEHDSLRVGGGSFEDDFDRLLAE